MPILPALLPDALAVLEEVVAEPVEFELAPVVEFPVAAATAAELVEEEAKLEDEAELDVPELEAEEEEEAAAADEEAAAEEEEEELGEAVVEAGAAAEEEDAAAVAAAPVPLD